MPDCPGKDMRNLKISFHPCPNCKKPVEMFSDEAQRRCPNCKTLVVKEQAPSCLQWCSAARDCFGPKLYDQIMGRMEGREPDEETAKTEELP
jgi:DNA-directed RNA polymerase subunit RPC12/RpoP